MLHTGRVKSVSHFHFEGASGAWENTSPLNGMVSGLFLVNL